MIRSVVFAALICFGLTVAGCSVMDWITGTPAPGTINPTPVSPAPIEKIASGVSAWWPFATGLAGAIVALWRHIRAGQYRSAGELALDQVMAIADINKDGKLDAAEVLAAIGPLTKLFQKTA